MSDREPQPDGEPEKLDLSALDPAADAERWARVVDATRLRMASALSERGRDAFGVVGDWARPILALAAGLLLVLGAADLAVGLHLTELSNARRLALLAESSVLHGRAPTGAELMAALRGHASTQGRTGW